MLTQTEYDAQSMMLDLPRPNQGGEDEANYALAWFAHYFIIGDPNVIKHFDALKAALMDWVEGKTDYSSKF